jgi:hypothetical protein
MLDRETVLLLVGLFALVVLTIGFAVRPFGRGSRFRRAPYGRLPGQVPIVGHRTAMEIKAAQERKATRAGTLRPDAASEPTADAPAADETAPDDSRREQA